MLDTSYCGHTDKTIAQYDDDRSARIPIISEIQKQYQGLLPERLNDVAQKLHIGQTKAYSVETLIKNFLWNTSSVCPACAGPSRYCSDCKKKLGLDGKGTSLTTCSLR